MKFDINQDTLFGELVVQTIIMLGPARNCEKLTNPSLFSAGDYVGGQADMGVDQEIHLLLEYAEVIDQKLRLRFDAAGLREHLQGAERFGIDLAWLVECFLSAVNEWHPLGYNHPIFSFGPFLIPAEFQNLFAAFAKANYILISGDRVQWTRRVTPIMGLIYWGITTERGADGRNELAAILEELPEEWRKKFDQKSLKDIDILETVLSNHWYDGSWHDAPVRGSMKPIYMRSAMSDRVFYIWQMVQGKLKQAK